jgi:hypothetical protein
MKALAMMLVRTLIAAMFVSAAGPLTFAQQAVPIQGGPGAGEIPRFDVESHCERTRGGHRAATNICINEAQRAYDTLKMMWNAVSAENKNKCAKWQDYQILLRCIVQWEQLDERRRMQERRPFRY